MSEYEYGQGPENNSKRLRDGEQLREESHIRFENRGAEMCPSKKGVWSLF